MHSINSLNSYDRSQHTAYIVNANTIVPSLFAISPSRVAHAHQSNYPTLTLFPNNMSQNTRLDNLDKCQCIRRQPDNSQQIADVIGGEPPRVRIGAPGSVMTRHQIREAPRVSYTLFCECGWRRCWYVYMRVTMC